VTAPLDAFPLSWPQGWRRAPLRTRARFNAKNRDAANSSYCYKRGLTIEEGTKRVLQELNRMGFSRSVVISSNLQLRNDGLPRSGQRAPDDPGVAVYWGTGREARCIAVDQYDKVADNLAAIAATLEAMRAIERHGGAAILERAFTGFTALPAPEHWFQILEVPATATRAEIEAAHRRLAMKHHPDRGGTAEQMAKINIARDDGLAQVKA